MIQKYKKMNIDRLATDYIYQNTFALTVLLGISWVTIIFEKNIQIFINELLIPNRFIPTQSLNLFVWLCSGQNDTVY